MPDIVAASRVLPSGLMCPPDYSAVVSNSLADWLVPGSLVRCHARHSAPYRTRHAYPDCRGCLPFLQAKEQPEHEDRIFRRHEMAW